MSFSTESMMMVEFEPFESTFIRLHSLQQMEISFNLSELLRVLPEILQLSRILTPSCPAPTCPTVTF